jgi:hypothetical protein
MSEALGSAAVIAFAVYVMFFDGLKVILGTLYTIMGG